MTTPSNSGSDGSFPKPMEINRPHWGSATPGSDKFEEAHLENDADFPSGIHHHKGEPGGVASFEHNHDLDYADISHNHSVITWLPLTIIPAHTQPAGYRQPRGCLDTRGFIVIEGMFTNTGALAANTVLATLPAIAWPSERLMFQLLQRFDVLANGDIVTVAALAAGNITLTGISYALA